MSGFGNPQSQIDVQFDATQPPTYYANIVQTWIVGDDAYLDFCMRSAQKPALRADQQCRIVTSMRNLKRLAQGLAEIVARWEQYQEQEQEQEHGGGPLAG